MIKSYATLPIIMALLATLAVLTSCQSTTVVKWRCPVLADPPSSTVDALEKAGRQDPSTASWVVQLDKHYQQCDIVNGTTR